MSLLPACARLAQWALLTMISGLKELSSVTKHRVCASLCQVNAKEPSKLYPRPSSAGSHDGGPFSGSDARGGSSHGNNVAGSQDSAVLCDAGNLVPRATSVSVLPSKAARTSGA